MNSHSLLTEKVISGRVQQLRKFARATKLRYSLVVMLEAAFGEQSDMEKVVQAEQGTQVGLQSSIPAR